MTILMPSDVDDYGGDILVEFKHYEYEFIDDARNPMVLVFKNILDEWINKYKLSIYYWLEHEYDILYEADYRFSTTVYGTTHEDYESIAVWFKDVEHFVMLKLIYG